MSKENVLASQGTQGTWHMGSKSSIVKVNFGGKSAFMPGTGNSNGSNDD